MSQLTQYIIALTNLYGMVHKSKIVDIYNSQNDEQISFGNKQGFLEATVETVETGSFGPARSLTI